MASIARGVGRGADEDGKMKSGRKGGTWSVGEKAIKVAYMAVM